VKKKATHLKSLEGKSKSEKKKIRQEYEEVKKRLENSQAKYVQKPKKSSGTMSTTEKKNAESRAMKRYHDRVWKGWRESDGKTYPVTGSGAKSANEKNI